MQRPSCSAGLSRAPSLPLFGVALGVCFGALQLLLLANPSLVTLDPEELYNAAHAEAILTEGLAMVLPLQYRPFCGGCTADALLGSGLFALLGPNLLAWKLVPILMGAAGVGALGQAVWRHSGATAGVAVATLLLATPPAWSRLGLVGWGNHYECSALVLMALAAASRIEPAATDASFPSRQRLSSGLLVGLLLGLGLWLGWSAAFAVTAVLAWLVLGRRWSELGGALMGIAVGASPVAVRGVLLGEWPTTTIYGEGELLPSLARLPAKLASLLSPVQLAGLIGVRHPLVGPVLGVLAALSLATALIWLTRGPRWDRLVVGLLGSWLLIYLVVRFPLQMSAWPDIPTAGGMRYAAPAMPLAVVAVGLTAAGWWRLGRRRSALLLASPWLIAGCMGRGLALGPPFPVLSPASMWAGDVSLFREQASWALTEDQHRAGLHSASARMRQVHAYALGRVSARAGGTALRPTAELAHADVQPAWAQGVAAALVDRLDPQATGAYSAMVLALTQVDVLSSGGWSAATRQAALREVAWRRVDGQAPRRLLEDIEDQADKAGQPPDSGAFAGTGLSSEAQQALWWALGRRFVRNRARLAQAETLILPAPGAHSKVARSLRDAFVEGAGQAAGQRWGPSAIDRPPRLNSAPQTLLDATSLAAWQRGVDTGQLSRWRTRATP